MRKKAKMTINTIETALGILLRVKKSMTGERMNERKTAKKKGKRTGLASRNTTPTIKMTMITRLATTTLLSFMTFFLGHIHYNPFRIEIKIIPPVIHPLRD